MHNAMIHKAIWNDKTGTLVITPKLGTNGTSIFRWSNGLITVAMKSN